MHWYKPTNALFVFCGGGPGRGVGVAGWGEVGGVVGGGMRGEGGGNYPSLVAVRGGGLEKEQQ